MAPTTTVKYTAYFCTCVSKPRALKKKRQNKMKQGAWWEEKGRGLVCVVEDAYSTRDILYVHCGVWGICILYMWASLFFLWKCVYLSRGKYQINWVSVVEPARCLAWVPGMGEGGREREGTRNVIYNQVQHLGNAESLARYRTKSVLQTCRLPLNMLLNTF